MVANQPENCCTEPSVPTCVADNERLILISGMITLDMPEIIRCLSACPTTIVETKVCLPSVTTGGTAAVSAASGILRNLRESTMRPVPCLFASLATDVAIVQYEARSAPRRIDRALTL